MRTYLYIDIQYLSPKCLVHFYIASCNIAPAIFLTISSWAQYLFNELGYLLKLLPLLGRRGRLRTEVARHVEQLFYNLDIQNEAQPLYTIYPALSQLKATQCPE